MESTSTKQTSERQIGRSSTKTLISARRVVIVRSLYLAFLLFGVSTCVSRIHGQCVNADFEGGSFSGWTGTYGISYTNGGCLYSNPTQYSGFLQGPLNDPSNSTVNHYCHVMTSAAGGNDAFLSTNGINVPMNWPGSGAYSARIGNTWPSGSTSGRNKPDAESMTYSFAVTPATAAFTYHYAVILNVGPGHIPTEQPYFHIRMITSAGDTINCASFDVDASSARLVGGFDSLNDNGGAGQIYYKRWSSVYIPLYNYIGQSVSVIFTTSSCNPNQCAGKHFAIAYLDAECGPTGISVAPQVACSHSSYTLTAPPGAASYSWTGPGITSATNGPVINVNQTGRYMVTMTTMGANPCVVSLDTMITVNPGTIFTAAFTAAPTCLGSPTSFNDLSIPPALITSRIWSLNGTTMGMTSQSASYTFPAVGTYPVTLTVGSSPCFADTTINVVVVAPPTSTFTATGPLCVGQTSTITYTGNGAPGDTYTWNFNGGTIVSGSAAGPYRISWATSGTKTITLTVANPTCSSAPTTRQVVVTPLPTITLAPVTYQCGGGTTSLSAVASPAGGTYLWNTGQATSSITISPAATTRYGVVYTLGTCSVATADTVTLTKPNAGTDQSISCAALPGGTASMSGTGTGTWTAMTGNPGTATITNTASPTTTITGFTAAGTYRFILTNTHGCTDTASIALTAKPSAGPDRTVSCVILPGGTTTMTATGAGTWTAMAGNPGTATISAASSPITTITGFTASGTYRFIWTNASGCTDTAAIAVTAKPNAGPDQTITCAVLPGGAVTMAGTGSGTWAAMTGNPGTANIAAVASPTTVISGFTAAGTYRFILTNASGCTDTAFVSVTAKPNAGADQTISCAILPGGSAIMAGTGVGTWSAMAGNPGTATITTASAPSSTITGFTAAGIYKFIWTNASGCSDTASVSVTAKPNAGPDKMISCIAIPGGSVAMSATGTGTWTAMTGNPGTAAIATATNPSTIISGYSAAGTYRFIWMNASGCSDTASVSITAKPDAGSDQAVSCITLPGGSATLSAIGTGTWTARSSNPGAATITTPANSTTSITRFTNVGTYRFVWTNTSGCTDTAAIVVTTKPNAGIDKTVNCATLPGGSVAMAGNGAGTWSAMTGNPGNAAISNTASAGSTITGFTVAGTYYFIWSNASGCNDTAAVTVTAKPDAGQDKVVNCATLPGGIATMSATGTGTWSVMTGNAGTANIANTTSPSTTISGFTSAGTYRFMWRNASGCSDTVSVTVTAKPNAGTDKFISCAILPGGTVTMSATGAGTWTQMASDPGTATITNIASPAAAISGFTAAGTYHFIWTNASGCSDTSSVIVTAKPNAGADQTISCATLPGGTAAMNASGTGTWTAMSGNPGTGAIVAPASPSTIISGFTAAGTYRFIWANTSGCSDTASVTVTAKPNAGSDQTISCAILPGGSATMNATGAGTWTAIAGNPGTATISNASNPTTGITGFTAAGTYRFIWTNASGCGDTASVVVTAKPNAGSDKSISCAMLPGGSVTMSGTGAATWTAMTGNPGNASITNATNPVSSITGFTAAGTYRFIWSNASGCNDTAAVTVTAKPDAGQDKVVNCTTLPGGMATMSATGTGTWSAVTGNAGTANITNTINPSTTISGFTSAGTYRFIWRNASGCSDTASITVTAKPNAGPDKTVSCAILPGESVTMSATGTGTWIQMAGDPGTATITNIASPVTVISGFTTAGTYHFIWTNSSGCSDTASVTVTAKPNAGNDQTISCATLPSGTAAMNATGTGIWTAMTGNPGTAIIVAVTNPATLISGFSAAGTYRFAWMNASGCSDTASVTVTAKPNAGSDQTISCAILPGGSATMNATGAGTWTAIAGNPGTATISNAPNPTTGITGFTAAGTYKFIWTNASGCGDTASVVVTERPNAGPDQTVTCVLIPGGSATMAATGIGIWTAMTGNPGNAVINAPASRNTTISNFTAAGTYKFIWSNASGCSDTASITVTRIPTVTLPGASYCQGGSATLVSAAAPAGGTYLWSNNATTSSISVNVNSTTHFTVTYTLGSCSASATDTVTVYQAPQATITTTSAICTANNGTAHVHASPATSGYSYSWSSPGGSRDSMINLTAGIYQVTVTDANHCTAAASGTVALRSPNISIHETSHHDLKCFNDASGEIHISATDSAAGAASLIYNWSNAMHSKDILHVQAGPYTVTVTDQLGCSATAAYTITQPAALSASTSATNPRCAGSANGTAALINPAGGSGSYHYTWSSNPVQHTQQAGNLPVGTYTVTMKDDSACVITRTIALTAPSAVSFGTPVITTPQCHGDSSGSAQIVAQNGTGTFSYVWSFRGLTSNPAIGLPAGAYTVTATDANGCSASMQVTLTQPTPLVVNITPSNATCFGVNDGNVTGASHGGTPPYRFHWSTHDSSDRVSNLSAGTYLMTVTDARGCAAIGSATLIQPAQITESITSVRPNCHDSKDGSITAVAAGGSGVFTYTLKDNSGTVLRTNNTNGKFTGLGYGTYMVLVTDHGACPVTDTISVVQPSLNVYTASAEAVSCYGSDYHDGAIHIQGSNTQNGPFQYSLDGGPFQSSSDFTGLTAGVHTVRTHDHYGCDTTFTVIVTEPSPAVVEIVPADTSIKTGASVQLISTFGPYPPDSIHGYQWSPAVGLTCLDCADPLASPYASQTVYTLSVIYGHGCVATATAQINIHGHPSLYIPNAFTPNGDEINDIWTIFGSGIKDVKAMVFNRWGEKVFESDNQFQGWDGYYKGELQPPSVYVYLVDVLYLNGETQTEKGSVSIIR